MLEEVKDNEFKKYVVGYIVYYFLSWSYMGWGEQKGGCPDDRKYTLAWECGL